MVGWGGGLLPRCSPPEGEWWPVAGVVAGAAAFGYVEGALSTRRSRLRLRGCWGRRRRHLSRAARHPPSPLQAWAPGPDGTAACADRAWPLLRRQRSAPAQQLAGQRGTGCAGRVLGLGTSAGPEHSYRALTGVSQHRAPGAAPARLMRPGAAPPAGCGRVPSGCLACRRRRLRPRRGAAAVSAAASSGHAGSPSRGPARAPDGGVARPLRAWLALARAGSTSLRLCVEGVRMLGPAPASSTQERLRCCWGRAGPVGASRSTRLRRLRLRAQLPASPQPPPAAAGGGTPRDPARAPDGSASSPL